MAHMIGTTLDERLVNFRYPSWTPSLKDPIIGNPIGTPLDVSSEAAWPFEAAAKSGVRAMLLAS